MRYIYLDHAATTFVKPEVLYAMIPFFTEHFGNPSSGYKIGQESKSAIEFARRQVASSIGAWSEEIYFTSGGSEADNLLIRGFCLANRRKGNHIITSKIEHMAVLNCCKEMESYGFRVTYLDVDEFGMIDLQELEKSITPQTILISIMFANNEIGTIQEIEKIASIAKNKGVFFHTDAVQAVGNININVKEMKIDALSMSAHKFYGPKGVGALYVKKGINFNPIIFGGHQEKNKRAGTENVPGIIGMGKAIEVATKNISYHNNKLSKMRDKYIEEVSKKISNAKLNGHPTNRLPGNANISFEGVDAETLALLLSEDNIYVSSGSACNTGSKKASHVLKAIGLNDEMARGGLRVTFGEENNEDDIKYVVKKITEHVRKIRLQYL